MVQFFLLIFILLFPVSSQAAYTVYLKNGSEIAGVHSYEKRDGEIIFYYCGGSVGIPEKDIVKIESTDTSEKDFTEEEPAASETEKAAPPVISAEEPPATERTDRAKKLQADLDAINAELKTVEDKETNINATLKEKFNSRQNWNPYQYRYLQQEIEPLQQDLSTIQQKKGELLQRKAYVEGELNSLQ